jgi:hypothetical protein
MNDILMLYPSSVYYSATDSILIPRSDLPKLSDFTGPGLGQLKIEAISEEAIIVRKGVYYLSDEHYRGFRGGEGIDVKSWYCQQKA